MKKTAQITVHLPDEDQQAVLALAFDSGVSASEWVRNLVTAHLQSEREHVYKMAEILGVRKTLCERELSDD